MICCIWQLMALLLLRHALSITDPDAEDDTATFFSVRQFEHEILLISDLCPAAQFIFKITLRLRKLMIFN